MKKHIALILIICVLFSAPGCVFLPNKVEETTAPTVLVTKAPSITKDEFYSYVDSICEATLFAGEYTIYWDGDTLTVDYLQDGLYQAAASAKGITQNMFRQSCYNSWATMADACKEVTATLRKNATDNGLDNVHVVINVLNDTNKEMALYSAYDGVVTYNFVTDQ